MLQLERGQDTILLTGDIEQRVERALLADGGLLRSEFLKIPHHGSRTSTTKPFLDSVHPRFAVISVGQNNPFGHPNAEVVQRIEAAGVQLYRTDRDGAVTVLSSGTDLTVRPFLPSD